LWEPLLTVFGWLNSDYIQIRSPVYISHSAGRYAVKRFRKAQCPIVERLTNSLMMNGRNNGKKLMAVRIVAHAFEIVGQALFPIPLASNGPIALAFLAPWSMRAIQIPPYIKAHVIHRST